MWKGHRYFHEAESFMESQWDDHAWSMIEGSDFSCVVDLAAGHGRNSAELVEIA